MAGPGSVVELDARAKINLRLNVFERDASGYHRIESIMHRIELADRMRVELAPAGTRDVACDIDVGPVAQNLAYRAAVAYLDATSWNIGFVITITKHIPAQGGLGGGSADAAATLQALNVLNPSPLDNDKLLDIAGALGSDVPFLASDTMMALAHGRGEQLTPLPPLPQRYVALVCPNFGVATSTAYGWIDEARSGNSRETEAQHVTLPPEELHDWDVLASYATNDFTAEVAKRHPLIPAIISTLRDAGATIAEMSGSGSTLYGIFPEEPDSRWLQERTGYPVLVTRTARAQAPLRLERVL